MKKLRYNDTYMKRIKTYLIVSFVLLIVVVVSFIFNKTPTLPKKTVSPVTKSKPEPKKQTSIFVPYWTDWSKAVDLSNYDRVIYFGVAANEDGIDTEELGYSRIKDFSMATDNSNRALTIRMTDTDINLKILQNKDSWEKIVEETIVIAKINKFKAVILDLEVGSLSFDHIVNNIYDFTKLFSQESHKEGLKFGILMYGDTFYRARPYYVEGIEKEVDEVLIMAYNMTKSTGEPGPNFPLSGHNDYGYDMQFMIRDFTKFVPKEKITVLFGMYGYDWQVDEKRRPISPGKSITVTEIKQKFATMNCLDVSPIAATTIPDCVMKRDDLSKEKEIDYVKSRVVGEYGYIDYHIIWYEDEKSAAFKTEYLLKQGIGGVGYWAYGYY